MHQEQKADLIKAFEHYAEAHQNLLELWNEVDHTGEAFTENYPFSYSFTELLHDVQKWVTTSKRNIETEADKAEVCSLTLSEIAEINKFFVENGYNGNRQFAIRQSRFNSSNTRPVTEIIIDGKVELLLNKG